MPSPVFLLHVCIVLGVPFFFGWVVLRRIVRETDWLMLIPGSVVAGAATLMALMNELRYWLEMSLATWFAYKLLLAAAFLLLLCTHPPRFPRLAVARRQRGWLALAGVGAVTAACYFGVPAARGLLHDAWWFHYPAATLAQDIARFPLPAVFAHDDPLYYHFGPDILAATWSHLLDRPVPFGFVFSVAMFAPAAFLLAYALVLRASRNHVGGLAAAVFLVIGGNLLFLALPAADASRPLTLLQALNSQSVDGLLKLMLTPSHCVGIPMVLLGLGLVRHFWRRPSALLAGLLGLWLGTLTLVAEWYFFPLTAAIGLLLFWPRFQRERVRPLPVWLRILPFIAAAAVGLFNNTYVAGIFGRFWVGASTFTAESNVRLERLRVAQRAAQELRLPWEPFDADRVRTPLQPPQPPWTPPPLIPLKLNLAHFGQVPSWRDARSNESGHLPVWHPRFLAECAPVILLGLPFGLWLAWRRGPLLARLLALLALISLAPPLFLDWGYRSTDFLRFLTGAFSFSALLLGWLVGYWWTRRRLLAVGVTACCLVNPLLFGWLGLNRATFEKLQDISERAGSLHEAAAAAPAAAPAPETVPQPQALKELAEQARRYLYPLTHGRERAVVLVPESQIPPTEAFPEWMKLATLMHIQLPAGWHWNDSLYAAHYRRAAHTLDAESLAALDARWVVVTNLFDAGPDDAVLQAIGNRRRFLPCATYHAGRYYLAVVRVLD